MKIKRLFASVVMVSLCCSMMFPRTAAVGIARNNSVVGAGMSHTIALQADGTVWTWGSNQEYQLGNENQSTEVEKPQKVEGLTSVISVEAGYTFSAAILYDGSVWAWGGGQVKVPAKVSGLSNIVAVACGQTQMIALKTDGTVWQWSIGKTATKVNGLSSIAGIAAGSQHFLARSNGGEIWAWGGNWAGQIGIGDKDDRTSPIKLDGIMNVVHVAAGQSHSLAVDFDGKVYAWGANANGQLGIGNSNEQLVPVQVESLKDIIQVAAGNETSVALASDGTMYTWGYGEFGQLGDGSDTISRNAPKAVPLAGFGKTSLIAAGIYHNVMVNTNGDLYAWGRNKNHQLGTGKSNNEKSLRQILTHISVPDSYNTNQLDGTSDWAKSELSALYNTNLVPPMLWQGYTDKMTRAEFAHMLVKVYEKIKKTEVSYSSRTPFTDLVDHPLRIDMIKASELRFISGTGGNHASPNASITRQEVAKMLCSFVSKAKGITISDKPQSLVYYADADQIAEWAAPSVAYAYTNDIMKGTGQGFSPNMLVTHEQGLLIMARLVEKYGW